MLLEKLERYVSYIDFLKEPEELPFDDILELYKNSDDEYRIKMLLELDEKTRKKIKSLINGGII